MFYGSTVEHRQGSRISESHKARHDNTSGEGKAIDFGILSSTVFKGSKQGKGFIVQVAHTLPKISIVHCFHCHSKGCLFSTIQWGVLF